MAIQLHYETITPLLKKVLQNMMSNPMFDPFVLVGGTSLSLRLGHRKSVDIDLFTNAPYGSLDYSILEEFFQKAYSYYDCVDKTGVVGMGRSYYMGNSVEDNIKVDLYYHDEIIDPPEIIDGIRIASLNDVTAMKIDVISRGGRKKDFWDLHELLNTYSISEMLNLHQQRNEYTHDRKRILINLSNFASADEDIDPVCLKHKEWALIKLDFVELMENLSSE
jgi:predicted nucleotidyltransferase component of viral defense system